jgi:transposase
MKHSFILGVDVASCQLDFCLFDTKFNKHLFESIDYEQTKLKQFLNKHKKTISPKDCLVGMESTGDYHLKVARFFLKQNFKVKLINPILTRQYTRTTIRGIKTDKSDSELICKLLLNNHGDSLELAQINDNRKDLLRLSTSLTHTAASLKVQVKSLKRKEVSGIENIEKDIKKIINQIKELSDGLVSKVSDNQTKEEIFIDSIPGFATKLSAIVHHEIGDINRFNNVKSLVAYAGLDPRIKQSGENLKTTGRITKRGNKHLRTALFIAANISRQYDQELKDYYDKKKEENRTHKEILVMISRKLLARIFTLLKEQREYVKKEIV